VIVTESSSAQEPMVEAIAIANDLAGLATAADRADLAERLRTEVERRANRGVAVLVAGARGAGKSSLINALVGRADLLPDDRRGSIPVPVVVRFGRTPSVRMYRDEGRPGEVGIDKLVGLASEVASDGRIRAIEVGLDDPILARGLLLIDSPAIDDPAAPSDVVAGCLAWADALLFVSDAGSPLRADEIRFLARAGERVGAVAVVLTKTDALPGWRVIADEDRGLLARSLPGYAAVPIVPVSAALRAKAVEIAERDPGLAGELVDESGIGPLATLLTERIAARAEVIRRANLIRAMDGVMTALELPQRAILAAEGGEAEQAEFDANQARLQDFAKASAAGLARLADALEIVRIELTAELAALVTGLSRRYEAEVTTADARRLAELSDALSLDLVELARQLTDRLEVRLVEAADSVARALAAEVQVAVEPIPAPSADSADVPVSSAPGLYAMFRTNYYPFLMGSGIVTIVGGLLATVVGIGTAAAAAPLTVASLAAGGLTVVLGRRAATGSEARTRARDAVRSVLADARTELQAWLQRRLLESRRAIESDLRDQLEARTHELRAAVERQQQVLSSDRATRQRAKADATARLEEIAAIRRRIAGLA
jgi:hypothetical protein